MITQFSPVRTRLRGTTWYWRISSFIRIVTVWNYLKIYFYVSREFFYPMERRCLGDLENAGKFLLTNSFWKKSIQVCIAVDLLTSKYFYSLYFINKIFTLLIVNRLTLIKLRFLIERKWKILVTATSTRCLRINYF